MEKGKVKKGLRVIVAHGKIFLRGIARTLYGAAVFWALYGVGYGLWCVKNESGYVAVFDFIGAIAMLVIAVVNIYAIGGNAGRRNGRA